MSVANVLLALDRKIRYVAINQLGAIDEMLQSEAHPSFNPRQVSIR